MAEEIKPSAGDAPPPPVPPQGPDFPLDNSRLSDAYANFCRVHQLPEEIILDFGLQTQVAPSSTEPIKMTHRLVMNYYTAKRLLFALHMAVQQYENAFGPIETNVGKRARPQPPRPPQTGVRPS
jgi:hypothetical protein